MASDPATGHNERRRCTHRSYDLDCEAYDRFVADHGGRCALCGKTGPETPQGYLVIDHDHGVGQWAVRGLLCWRCNNVLDAYRHVKTPTENAYLADPWWRRHFGGLGLPVDQAPEPPIGTTVAADCFRWTRTRRGWERPRASHGPMTWEKLNRLYGPHKVQVVVEESRCAAAG
jgi:hypothetical protein